MSGFSLLNTLGLLALGALAIPVVIHLFSRSRGRRIWVGNIALYRQPAQQRVFEPRIQQWLLLLLRLLLLVVAAFWLADLAKLERAQLTGDAVYVTPRWLASASGDAIEALGGDHQFLIAPDFPPLASASEGGVEGGVEGVGPNTDTPDVLSLLSTRLGNVEHIGSVDVYAVATREQFPVAIRGLGGDLRWHLSEPRKAAAQPSGSHLDVLIAHGPGRLADAQLLASALKNSGDRLGWRVEVSLLTPDQLVTEPPAGARRVAVLLGVVAPQAYDQAALVFEDSRGSSSVTSFLQLHTVPGERFRVAPVQRDIPDARVIWRSDDGAPVLVGTHVAGQTRLVYLDRLTTTDGGLMRSAAFPRELLRLLIGEAEWAKGFDGAVANPVGLLQSGEPEPRQAEHSLADWLAVLLVLLVLAERVLAERRSRLIET